MIIRFDTNDKNIECVNRFNLKLVNSEKIVDVGAKNLPINLGDVFHKALSFHNSNFVTSSVYISNNNNIERSNNIKNNIYTLNVTKFTLDKIKEKAKGELIDLHFFPVKFTSGTESKERAYVEYNLRKALVVMIEMEQSLRWLIGYNQNVQFIVEKRDITKTLWSIANRLSNNKAIKAECVELVENLYDELDSKYISRKFKDFWWNVDFFIGKELFLKNITNFDKYDKNQYIGVYVYGDKREDAWRNITHKLDDSLCLFVDNEKKMMLKRIKNTMTGQEFHKYLNELIGKWFDLNDSKIWSAIRQNMHRINEEKLDKNYNVEMCKIVVKDYFEKLGDLCYNGEMVDNREENKDTFFENIISNQQETHIEATVQMDVNPIQQPTETPRESKETTKTGKHISISTTYEEFPKTEDGSTDWSKVEKDHKFDGLDGDDFWEAMSRL